jgi:hypothetical protein
MEGNTRSRVLSVISGGGTKFELLFGIIRENMYYKNIVMYLVTRHGGWIGNWIYWTVTTSN